MLNWKQVELELNERGFATTAAVLTEAECDSLIHMYSAPQHFRSKIVMERFRFGSGEYQYFSYPLPQPVQGLRERFYPFLAAVANRWMEWLAYPVRYPSELNEYLDQCHAKGQTRPTPLMLKYETGGYNCLHQDLYGELRFPFQCTILLSSPNDFEGGEFLLVEQRPRAQSRGEAIVLRQGEMIIFPVRERPVRGAKGFYRTTMKHGVSTVRKGTRFTLGIIFHDAK